MRRLLRSVTSLVRDDDGQDLLEYVLLVALIAYSTDRDRWFRGL